MTVKYVVVTKKGNTTKYTSLITGDIRKHAEKTACDLSWKLDAGEIDRYYIFKCVDGHQVGNHYADSEYHWVNEGNAWVCYDGSGNELNRISA